MAPQHRRAGGSINEAAELDYVRFTTLAEYMKNHPPVGEIEFGQDLADGNFNGYNNWAEKAFAPEIWTAVENNRRVHEAAAQALRYLGLSDAPEKLAAGLASMVK